MNTLPHAVTAAQQGWAVFPTEPAGKKPHPGLGAHWGPLPTTDLATIAVWWTRWPDANIAIACKPSGLLVIDCDPPKHDGDVDGLDEYTTIWQQHDHGDMFDTHIVATPSGGLHFYYQWSPHLHAKGATLHNTKNVDIRGNNGQDGNYVIAAGSQTPTGQYRTEHARTPAPCPAWLGQWIINPPRPPRPPTAPAPPPTGRAGTRGNNGALLAWLTQQPPGQQDNQIQWAARCLKDDGLAEADAAAQLWQAVSQMACQSGRPAWTEQDVQRHIRSAYRTNT